MTGKTHRDGGTLCTIVGFILLRDRGLLVEGVNPFVQLAVMYPFTLWGSVASDFDHHWESCPSKDIASRLVNKALHITNPLYKRLDEKLSASEKKTDRLYKFAKVSSCRHRSWQTHSDLTLVLLIGALYSILSGKASGGYLSGIDMSILSIVLTGIILGFIAHFILDMLTPEGVWSVLAVMINTVTGSKLRVKYGFVPKKRAFATGGAWENFVRWWLKLLTWVALAYLILTSLPSDVSNQIRDFAYNIFPYEISFK